MRGPDTFTESLFTLRKLEDFVPADHALRPIRQMVNAAFVKMDSLFSGMYEADIKGGRPASRPRSSCTPCSGSVRSERQLIEQTQYNLLFRSFIGRQVMMCGLKKVDQMFVLTMAAYKKCAQRERKFDDVSEPK